MRLSRAFVVSFGWAISPCRVYADVTASEDSTGLFMGNDRLSVTVLKASGAISSLLLDGQDLLGPTEGSSGVMYLDCYCTPNGFWTPGSTSPTFELYSGADATGASFAGVRVSDTYTATGQVLEQYWFLREGETGLHSFSRVAYHNSTTPFLRNLQEFRTLFRPNTDIWTHLMTNEQHFGPRPSPDALDEAVVVQDATWYLGDLQNEPYVQQMSDYFTKYTFQDTWRDHAAHGMYSDGSQIADNSTFGAWLVMNTRETYFGGPLHSDLVVDGIVYDYMVSNHHGDQTPNITDGFDRTFGPQYYHFNHFPQGTDLRTLYDDAAQYADPEWNADFYDSIAEHVPNYVKSAERGSVEVSVDLPKEAKNAIAVLAQDGVDFQDNVFDTRAYQYWAKIDENGRARIPRVKSDTYRLTIYADNVFGDYTQDHVQVSDGKTARVRAKWREETHGKEVFRIGVPDKSSGEYRHGYERDVAHPLRPEQYRIYWAAWDFVDDFPDGIVYKVGRDDVGQDLNYVHWSVFGGYANHVRPEPYYGDGNVNNWTIRFDLDDPELLRGPKREATFTVQLAGVKTAAGNTDIFNASEPHANLRYTVSINSHELEPWVIPYHQSSSCAVRSAVICYNVAHKFVFDASLLRASGEKKEKGGTANTNELILSLPFNATNYESAVLPQSVYVQYDAMRLEIG